MSNCSRCQTPSPPGSKLCGNCGTPIPVSAGTVLHGYNIVKHLKSGGMGSVYSATTDFGGQFVVKELLDLHANPRDRQEAIESFEREAKLLRTLRHPAIPRVIDHFTEGGRWYLVMDMVEGEDLEERMKRTRSGSIPETVVHDWAMQLCSVLEYLHQHQPPVIFRDLKPANIMVSDKNELALVDFGIAKVFAPKQRGTQIGTPGYAAPEQYHGLACPRSDIFALGATLYHLLTGHDPSNFPPSRAFDGWEWNRIPSNWAPVLRRALELQEQNRFRDIGEFRRSIPGSAPAPAPKPAPPTLPAPIPPPKPSTMPIASAMVVSAGMPLMSAAGIPGALSFLSVPGLGVAMAKYPVTNKEYHEFVRATGYTSPQHWLNGQIPSSQELHPVVWVSLADAQAFCAWAGARLPTETEWLKAAQGNDQRPWPWGFNFEPCGNFDQRNTTPVDWYPDGATPCGCVDMAGNVWEWTATTTSDGQQVVKGGSFYGPRRITDRGTYQPHTRNAVIGFRVCK